MRSTVPMAVAIALIAGTPRARAEDSAPIARDVVIRGDKTRSRLPPRDRGVAGSMIQGESLRAPGKQAAEVLRAEPGVGIVETGGQGSVATASIRGATSAQTPVYLAGVRLNDDIAGTADLSLAPLWLMQRVEIYRGNAPLEADQLGIGGALFFEPLRPTKSAVAAGALAGSYGTRGAWAYGSAVSSGTATLAGVRIDHARNDFPYVDDRGTRFDSSDDITRRRANADVSTLDAWVIASADMGRGARVDTVFNGVQREQGIPGLSLIPSRSARGTLRRGLAAISASIPCDSEGRCVAAASTSGTVAVSDFDDPLGEIALGAPHVQVSGQRVEQAGSARVDVTDRVTIVPSIRGAMERLHVDPDGADGLRASRVSSRSALGAEWRASSHATLRALASGECHGTSRTGTLFCSSVIPAGRLGGQLTFGSVSFLANAGRYVRVPTLGELYGLAGAVRGNPGLTEEKGVTLDLGMRAAVRPAGAFSGAWLDIFAFSRTASDLIAWRRSSLGYVRPYNVGDARIRGLELLTGAGLGSFLDAEVSATLLDPKDISEHRVLRNDILPLRSRLVLAPSVRLHTEAARTSGIDLLSLEARCIHQASRYADDAGLVVIPAQTTLDFEASSIFLHEHLALRVRVSDALDAARYDVIGYPLPGRAWYGATELRW